MKKIIHSVSTQYQIIGTGQPLVMLHGWGCDWQIFSAIIPDLSDQFQLIIPDIPTFGQSAQPSVDWRTADFVEWLTEFVEQTTGKKKFGLLGHSFGGKLAAVYAGTKRPLHLEKLMLVDASGLPDPLSPRQKLRQQLISLIPTQLKQAVPASVKHTAISATNSSSDYAVATPYQKRFLKKSLQERIDPALQQIQAPTKVIWGDRDRDTPIHQAKQFHLLITDSKLTVVPRAGHFPFIDSPQEFLNAVY